MKAFDALYYSFSPTVASAVASSQTMAATVRLLLYPLLSILWASSILFHTFGFALELGIAVAGVFSSALLGIIYVTPAALGIQYLLKKRNNAYRPVKASPTGLTKDKRDRPEAGVSQ